MIIVATLAHAQSLHYLLERTVRHSYPSYYSKGVVDFFVARHSLLAIQEDIMRKEVYVYEVKDEVVGSITIKDDEVYRLFVVPEHQKKGYGKELLDFAEAIFKERAMNTRLDASLPSKDFFLAHGYKEKAYRKVQLDSGDIYCYDIMVKLLEGEKEIEASKTGCSFKQ